MCSTPARRAKNYKSCSPECTLCQAPNADEAHIFSHCTHETMIRKREELDNQLKTMILSHLPKRDIYMETHTRIPHPATLIDPRKLYPHASDMPSNWPGQPTPLCRDLLPESLWYRSHKKNVVSIHDPTRPAIRAQTILTTSFWRLIACHAPCPLPTSPGSILPTSERYI